MSEFGQGPVRTRRSFLDWFLGTTAGGLVLSVLYPVSRYIIPPEVAESSSASVTVPFTPDEIAPNTAKVFKFGSRAGLLLRTAEGELRAMEAACTHLGCIVQYRPDIAHVWCACHNGHFDLNGHNLSGPPPGPLEQYAVNVRDDQIIVSKVT